MNSVDQSLNQIDSNPDFQNTFNSKNALNQRKGSNTFKDTMNSTISSQKMVNVENSKINDSIILSAFLAQ